MWSFVTEVLVNPGFLAEVLPNIYWRCLGHGVL